jgi:2-polyprenyl-3-methyl-5-hydroxy-6-metoxy-1,4-benzoquinol methylase
MTNPARDKWNDIYAAADNSTPTAALVLQQNIHLLPSTGHALDLACGTGGNALLLAKQGLDCWAWDISDIALNILQAHAEQQHYSIQTEQKDIVTDVFPANFFDVIVISHFLERSICDKIIKSLNENGILLYQTFTVETADRNSGPRNPRYRLMPNELLQLFAKLQLLAYREDTSSGDLTQGMREEAYLIGKKQENSQ